MPLTQTDLCKWHG